MTPDRIRELMAGEGKGESRMSEDFRAGERVHYVPYHANGDIRHRDCENGIVTSTNDRFVFVKFNQNHDYGKACKPDQLRKIGSEG